MIAIIGAGVSGLATAFYLQKQGIPYIILEASNRVGGNISTTLDGPYLMENGPNSLLCDTEVWNILEETGIKSEVVYPNDVSKARYILKNKQYQKLSPPKLVFSSFFSWGTKFSLLLEPFKKGVDIENESVASFFKRRFSQQIVDYAVNPFVAGIYAGDPEKLLIKYTFPALYEIEKEYGSIIRGFLKKKEKTDRKESISFSGGMQTIPTVLAKELNLKRNTPVSSLQKTEAGYLINNEIEASQLIITTPAHPTANFLKTSHPEFSEALNSLDYPPMCIIHSVFKKEKNAFHFNGFGGLHPAKEKCFTAGSIWSSSLFNNRAPEDEILLTSFVGGRQSAHNAELDDDEVLKRTTQEIKDLFNMNATPIKQKLYRWEKAIPQYDKQLNQVAPHISNLEKEGIYICANWWKGVSVADCLKKGKQLAKKLCKTSP